MGQGHGWLPAWRTMPSQQWLQYFPRVSGSALVSLQRLHLNLCRYSGPSEPTRAIFRKVSTSELWLPSLGSPPKATKYGPQSLLLGPFSRGSCSKSSLGPL
eukprot:7753046-Heterocapsa_arctica.AAC.1